MAAFNGLKNPSSMGLYEKRPWLAGMPAPPRSDSEWLLQLELGTLDLQVSRAILR